MKFRPMTLPILAATAAVSACGGGTNAVMGPPGKPTAPYANAYSATYASAGKTTMAEALQEPAHKLQGLAAPLTEAFGDPSTSTLGEVQPFEIEKTADGYMLRMAGQEMAFTGAEIITDSDGYQYYELTGTDSDGDTVNLASFFSLSESTPDALASSSANMVPLGYFVRTRSDGGQVTPDEADGSVKGYTVVGLETDPSEMPTAGTATYSGQGRLDAYVKSVNWDVQQRERVQFHGDSSLTANFETGKISGGIAITRSRENWTQTGSTDWDDVSGEGGAIILNETDIVANGFESELSANAAAEAMLDDYGIDVEAKAVGRFYGQDAGGVGAVIGGDGTHVVTGFITADRD